MNSYRELQVWRKSVAFVTEIYCVTGSFPKEELYGLASQLRRCAVSIPSNIAEGYGRYSTADYIHFLSISIGSLYECQTQLEIARNLTYLEEETFNVLSQSSQEIEKMMTTIVRKLMKVGSEKGDH